MVLPYSIDLFMHRYHYISNMKYYKLVYVMKNKILREFPPLPGALLVLSQAYRVIVLELLQAEMLLLLFLTYTNADC